MIPIPACQESREPQPVICDFDPVHRENPGRIASIDTIKTVSVFAVICVHSMPFRGYMNTLNGVIDQLCRFAVPFFFTAAGYLFALNTRNQQSPAWFKKYLGRLAALYVAWCVIYLLVPSLRLVAAHGLLKGTYLSACARLSQKSGLLHLLSTGTERHLWFFASLLSAIPVLYLFRKPERQALLIAVAAALYVVGLLAGSYSVTPLGLQIGFDTRNGPFFSTLFVTLGFLMGSRNPSPPAAGTACAIVLAGLAVHMSEALALQKVFGVPLARHDFLIGSVLTASGLMLLAIAKPGLGNGSLIARCGNYTLGIYVLHYMADIGLRRAVSLNTPAWHLAHPAIVFLLTLAAVLAAARIPVVKRLVV